MTNKHPLSLILGILVTLLVSCSKPGEETINVSRTTGGTKRISLFGGDSTTTPVKTENTAVKVQDLKWRKQGVLPEDSGGVWVGYPGMWRPADTDAVEAIDAYMKAK